MMFAISCPHQAQPQDPAGQVQGPLPALRLHPCPEGLRQGRQAQAELAPRCVAFQAHLKTLGRYSDFNLARSAGLHGLGGGSGT